MYNCGNIIENLAQCYLSHDYIWFESDDKYRKCYLNVCNHIVFDFEDIMEKKGRKKVSQEIQNNAEFLCLTCFPEMHHKLIWKYLEKLNNEEYTKHFQEFPFRDDRFTLEFRVFFNRIDGGYGFSNFEQSAIYPIIKKWCRCHDLI